MSRHLRNAGVFRDAGEAESFGDLLSMFRPREWTGIDECIDVEIRVNGEEALADEGGLVAFTEIAKRGQIRLAGGAEARVELPHCATEGHGGSIIALQKSD